MTNAALTVDIDNKGLDHRQVSVLVEELLDCTLLIGHDLTAFLSLALFVKMGI